MASFGLELELHGAVIQINVYQMIITRPGLSDVVVCAKDIIPGIRLRIACIGPSVSAEETGLLALLDLLRANRAPGVFFPSIEPPLTLYGSEVLQFWLKPDEGYPEQSPSLYITLSVDHFSNFMCPELIMFYPIGRFEHAVRPDDHLINLIQSLYNKAYELNSPTNRVTYPCSFEYQKFSSALRQLNTFEKAQVIIKGETIISPRPDSSPPVIYQQVTMAMDLTWFSSFCAELPAHQDALVALMRMNMDPPRIENAIDEINVLGTIRCALKETRREVPLAGAELWIEGAIGMALFHIIILCRGVYISGTTKNFWILFAKTSISEVLSAAFSAAPNIYLYYLRNLLPYLTGLDTTDAVNPSKTNRSRILDRVGSYILDFIPEKDRSKLLQLQSNAMPLETPHFIGKLALYTLLYPSKNHNKEAFLDFLGPSPLLDRTSSDLECNFFLKLVEMMQFNSFIPAGAQPGAGRPKFELRAFQRFGAEQKANIRVFLENLLPKLAAVGGPPHGLHYPRSPSGEDSQSSIDQTEPIVSAPLHGVWFPYFAESGRRGVVAPEERERRVKEWFEQLKSGK